MHIKLSSLLLIKLTFSCYHFLARICKSKWRLNTGETHVRGKNTCIMYFLDLSCSLADSVLFFN